MVIVSAGVRPNLGWQAPGLEMKNGILVNDRLETKQAGVFAAGDVAEHRGRVYGIWPAAQKQGEAAGSTWRTEMHGTRERSYRIR